MAVARALVAEPALVLADEPTGNVDTRASNEIVALLRQVSDEWGRYVLFIFLAIPSLIAMLNTLTIGVIERTREIGTLRAVGAAQKQVRRMVLIEALLLAAIGTAFGLLAGLYLGYALIYAFRTGGFPMDYVFPWSGLLIATAVGLLFGGLAAIIPARQAARLAIVQALRYE